MAADSLHSPVPDERVNPYVLALRSLARRLVWDLDPVSWRSRKRMKRVKNQYAGQKAVILCNGPSLNHVDFDLLQAESIFTFGLNKINLLFEKTDFRPSCIVSVNPFVIEQNREFYNATSLPVFLDFKGKKWVLLRENIYFLHSAGFPGNFARDCSISVVQGSTVTYVAMQLAFHMGFTDVALVGCDHNFQTQGLPNAQVQAGKKDPNHFDTRYFSNGMTWQLPDLASSEFHFEKARHVYTLFQRRIVNCTEGGHLEIFERIPLNSFLKT